MEGIAGRTYRPEQLPRMLDFGRWELVDGKLIERVTSVGASLVSVRLLSALWEYAKPRDLGHVLASKLALRIYSDDSKVRLADGCFVARGRIDRGDWGDDFLRVPPDLVLESVSSGEKATYLDEKVTEYLEAGVRLVWIAYPATKSVHVLRPGGSGSLITHERTLSGEDVVPGFSMPVAAIFDF